MAHIQRRQFITLLGGVAAWPIGARAQQADRIRRIGALMNLTEGHPSGLQFLAAFREGLQELGRAEGGNLRLDVRLGGGNDDRNRAHAADLVALGPDVILASDTRTVLALQRTSRSAPIVFVGVIDAVGSGLVASLPRPGGNATGFLVFEYGIAAKWLELLKEIAPGVTRVAVVRDPTISDLERGKSTA